MSNAPLSSTGPAGFSRPANVIPQDSLTRQPGPATGPGAIPRASAPRPGNGASAGTGNRVEQKKQEKVAAIFKAAEDLLLEHGYHSTTIDRIAKQAGVSVGSAK